jgi:hypothetical protein
MQISTMYPRPAVGGVVGPPRSAYPGAPAPAYGAPAPGYPAPHQVRPSSNRRSKRTSWVLFFCFLFLFSAPVSPSSSVTVNVGGWTVQPSAAVHTFFIRVRCVTATAWGCWDSRGLAEWGRADMGVVVTSGAAVNGFGKGGGTEAGGGGGGVLWPHPELACHVNCVYVCCKSPLGAERRQCTTRCVCIAQRRVCFLSTSLLWPPCEPQGLSVVWCVCLIAQDPA